MAAVASLVATAVSGLFSITLARRYTSGGRRNRALLHWGISLGMFCLASAMLAVGVLAGWSPSVFRLFYLFGAVLNVPWLAMGSVRINARSRPTTRATGAVTLATGGAFLAIALMSSQPLLVAPGAALGILWGLVLLVADEDGIGAASTALLGVFAASAAFTVLSVALTAPVPHHVLPEGRDLFPVAARGFAVGGNAVGSVIVVLGAIISTIVLAVTAMRPHLRREVSRVAWRAPVEALAQLALTGARAARRAGLSHIAKGNLLIALGVLVAASGGAASFLGQTTANAVALSIGVTIMYLGFVRTTRPDAPRDTAEMAADPR